jgi:hypothetical protein
MLVVMALVIGNVSESRLFAPVGDNYKNNYGKNTK